MLVGLKPPSWFFSWQLIQDSLVRMILRATQGPFREIGAWGLRGQERPSEVESWGLRTNHTAVRGKELRAEQSACCTVGFVVVSRSWDQIQRKDLSVQTAWGHTVHHGGEGMATPWWSERVPGWNTSPARTSKSRTQRPDRKWDQVINRKIWLPEAPPLKDSTTYTNSKPSWGPRVWMCVSTRKISHSDHNSCYIATVWPCPREKGAELQEVMLTVNQDLAAGLKGSTLLHSHLYLRDIL